MYEFVVLVDSMMGYKDIFLVLNLGSCIVNGLIMSNCFCLIVVVWDLVGRGLFVGSDNSVEGEIYVLIFN